MKPADTYGCSMKVRATERAQQVEGLATKPDDLSLIPQDPHGGIRDLTPGSCLLTCTHSNTSVPALPSPWNTHTNHNGNDAKNKLHL